MTKDSNGSSYKSTVTISDMIYLVLATVNLITVANTDSR